MTDIQANKILEKLRKGIFSNYYVAKKTGFSPSSLANWRSGKSKPTPANIAMLEYFFDTEMQKSDNNAINQSIMGSNNIISQAQGKGSVSNIDNRQYNGGSVGIPPIEIGDKDKLLLEKDKLIAEKDERIREKDERIRELIEEKLELKQIINELKSK